MHRFLYLTGVIKISCLFQVQIKCLSRVKTENLEPFREKKGGDMLFDCLFVIQSKKNNRLKQCTQRHGIKRDF